MASFTNGVLQLLTISLLVIAPTVVNSNMVIPKRSLGYVYRPSKAVHSNVVTLTAYLDMSCPDSKQAYPTLLKLADQLASSPKSNFELVLLSFSLPYHRNSHVISKAIHIVNEYSNGASVFPFITNVYNNLDLLVPSATANKTDYQVIDILAPLVNKSAGIPNDTFKQKLSDSSYDQAARLDFKYGCTRAVYATPTFMVNDVVVAASQAWTVAQWMDLLGPLL